MYWFVHLGVITELNTWDSFCPGRLDQHLYPFYKREVDEGTLTKENAMELLECFWVKDRKSTRLNSSHANISYAVFCLKKKYKDMNIGLLLYYVPIAAIRTM